MALFYFYFLSSFRGLGKENFKIIKNRPLCHYRHINSCTVARPHTHFAIAT